MVNKKNKLQAKKREKNYTQEPEKTKKNFVEIVKGILTANNSHIYISALLVIIGCMFYQLGYSFIYVYYLGSNAQYGKLMDVMVNQIPFDFKLIVTIGVCILLFSICFCSTLYMYMLRDEINSKIAYIIFHIATISILYLTILLLVGNDTKNTGLYIIMIYTTMLSSVILFFLFMFKMIKNSIGDSLFISIGKIIIIIIDLISIISANYKLVLWLDSQKYLNNLVSNLLYSSFLLIQAVITTGLLDILFLDKIKVKIKINKKYLLLALEVIPIIFLLMNASILGKVILVITYVSILVIRKIKNYNNIKKNKDTVEYVKSNNDKPKNERNKDAMITFIIMVAMIVMIYLIGYGLVNNLGNALGKTLNLNTKSKITYYNTNHDENCKSLYGVVVQQSGSTYYISNENRELVVITSPYVEIEPCDDKDK